MFVNKFDNSFLQVQENHMNRINIFKFEISYNCIIYLRISNKRFELQKIVSHTFHDWYFLLN